MASGLTRGRSTELSSADWESLASLRRSIVRGRGLTILLAVCNDPVRRDRLISLLDEQLPEPAVVVRVAPDSRDVLDDIDHHSGIGDDRPLCIIDLEKGYRHDPRFYDRLIALNLRREEWRHRVPRPVVFWIPEFALGLLAKNAPDFLNWRAGTLFFLPSSLPVSSGPGIDLAERSGEWRLTAEERAARIRRLEELLGEFEASADPTIVQRWRVELLRHHYITGDVASAGDVLQRALAHIDAENDPRGAAALFDVQAYFLERAGRLQDALRIRREEELPIYERLGDVQSRAVTMGQIADILQARGEFDEALRIRREEELPIYERLGDVREHAIAMSKIADILEARGELDEALRIRRKEQLPVYERLGDLRSRAITLGKIADIIQLRGETDEALRIRREEELPVYERLGDVQSHAMTMGRIADILEARGETDEALRILREEVLPVFERLGDVRSRAVTMGKIADILQGGGELDEALRIRREQELPIFERLGDVRERAITMGKIAEILEARGELDEALRIRREEELPVYERLGDVRSRAITMDNIAKIIRRGG